MLKILRKSTDTPRRGAKRPEMIGSGGSNMKPPISKVFSTSFGVFSPTGYVVMVFDSDVDAERARLSMLDNGFREEDVTRYTGGEVMEELEKSADHSLDPVQIGQDVAKVEQYLALAKNGSGFLLLHAPEDEAARSAVEVVHNFGLKFAEKYNRLTIEELG
jgi:hypothetical protein